AVARLDQTSKRVDAVATREAVEGGQGSGSVHFEHCPAPRVATSGPAVSRRAIEVPVAGLDQGRPLGRCRRRCLFRWRWATTPAGLVSCQFLQPFISSSCARTIRFESIAGRTG